MDPRVELLVAQIKAGRANLRALAFRSEGERDRAFGQAYEALDGDPAHLRRILPLLGFTSQERVDAIRLRDRPEELPVMPYVPVFEVVNPVLVWYRDQRGLRHVGETVCMSEHHLTVQLFGDNQYGADDETPAPGARPAGRTREFVVGSGGGWVDANGFSLHANF